MNLLFDTERRLHVRAPSPSDVIEQAYIADRMAKSAKLIVRITNMINRANKMMYLQYDAGHRRHMDLIQEMMLKRRPWHDEEDPILRQISRDIFDLNRRIIALRRRLRTCMAAGVIYGSREVKSIENF